MQTIRKINDELAIAGQVSSEELAQVVQQGFCSVLNLRSPGEHNFSVAEQLEAETMGLQYLNLPLELSEISTERATLILQQMYRLPKPILIHCDTAIRAAAIALVYIAVQQGATLEQALQQAQGLGLFTPLTQVYRRSPVERGGGDEAEPLPRIGI